MDQAPRSLGARPAVTGQLGLMWLGWLSCVLVICAFWTPALYHSFEALAHPPAIAYPALKSAFMTARGHATYHVFLDLFFGLGSLTISALVLLRHPEDRLAVAAAFVLALWGPTNGLAVESLTGDAWPARIGCAIGWLALAWLVRFSFQIYAAEPPLRTRQQIRWLWYGTATGLVLLVIVAAVIGTNFTLDAAQIDRHMTGHLLLVSGGALFPAALIAGWLLPEVPDPDTLIRRTLLYGGLMTVAVAVTICLVLLPAFFYYALGPVYLLAVVCVWAVAGLPLQQFLQRSINRMLYGQREEPMTVLNDLGDRLELGSPETVLMTIVETVAQSLKLPAVAIRAEAGGGDLAAIGTFTLEPASIPIVHHGARVGELIASPRARDEPLHERDYDILRLIARQAGPTVRAVQLNQELRLSRQQILSGREEERRRIRRDLHDGLGPAMAAIAMQVDTARAIIDDDPVTARQLLTAVTSQAEDVIHEVRRLVYDLRPPALDELGFIGAIERLARQSSSAALHIEVSGPGSVRIADAAVEVAAYRIVAEALTNVVRHAHAHNCTVRVDPRSVGATLEITVEDDGMGIGDDAIAGIGLGSMRERANEVGGMLSAERRPGGGTRVAIRLPLRGQS